LCARASRAFPGALEIPPGRRAGYGAKRGKKGACSSSASRGSEGEGDGDGEKERERGVRACVYTCVYMCVGAKRGEIDRRRRARTGRARRLRGSVMRRESRPLGIAAL